MSDLLSLFLSEKLWLFLNVIVSNMYICKCGSDKTGLYDNVVIDLCFIICSKKNP